MATLLRLFCFAQGNCVVEVHVSVAVKAVSAHSVHAFISAVMYTSSVKAALVGLNIYLIGIQGANKNSYMYAVTSWAVRLIRHG